MARLGIVFSGAGGKMRRDYMITFPNGRKISTICISTALGIDGRGILPRMISGDYRDLISTVHSTNTTIFGKSTTRRKRSGNFHFWRPWTWKYIQNFGVDGMLNAYGLTNQGVDAHSKEIARAVGRDIQIIPNFFPFFNEGKEVASKDVFDAIDIFRARMGKNFWAIELSFSCPNTKECITDNTDSAVWLMTRAKAYAPDIMFIVKISVVHPFGFAQQLHEAGADVIHSANTIPYNILYEGASPLQKVGGGGVSGGPAFVMAHEYNAELLQYYSGPIILGCGIVGKSKMLKYLQLASGRENQVSFSMCTAVLRRPKWAKKQVLSYSKQ